MMSTCDHYWNGNGFVICIMLQFFLNFNQFLIRLKVDDVWLKQRERMCRRKAHLHLRVSESFRQPTESKKFESNQCDPRAEILSIFARKIMKNRCKQWGWSGFSLARNIFGASLERFENYDRFTHRRSSTWLSNTSQIISWAQQRRKRCTTSKINTWNDDGKNYIKHPR